MPRGKDERVEDVPDASPDADRRRDNDELREEAVTDERTDPRVLHAYSVVSHTHTIVSQLVSKRIRLRWHNVRTTAQSLIHTQ